MRPKYLKPKRELVPRAEYARNRLAAEQGAELPGKVVVLRTKPARAAKTYGAKQWNQCIRIRWD